MRKLFILIAGFLSGNALLLHGQTFVGFTRVDSVRVYSGAQNLLFPWAGGINFAQISEIDLNLDGIKDLFVFDRSGNKITTYLNLGTPNQVDYVLAPQYISRFPLLHDWALLRDYNCDGKADIFTYSIAGFAIYKNTSTLAGGVSFQLMQNMVNTDRSPNSTHFIGNLYVSQVDLPAIRDVDGDGDLDVLTFENGGSRIEYHQNMSMEFYGVCDSIKYQVASNCWGEMTESVLNANISFGTSCPPPPVIDRNGVDVYSALHNSLHSGSCLECINTNGDNDQDVLIGDISSSAMAYVRNGGTSTYAIGDLADQTFPSNTTNVGMDVFNCGFHLDVDNDGLKDILVCPSAQNVSEDHRSVWFYKNIGQNDSVVVTYVENDFLQKDMLDFGEGCHPVFFDYDNDGDKDLFVGNYGYYRSGNPYRTKIALLKNIGTSALPVFDFITDDFGNLYATNPTLAGMAPTFGDVDGDGDADLLCGNNIGQIYFFRKDPGPADNFVLANSNFQSIDVGNYATPQIIDVDRDGVFDLLIGEQSGNINYYRNTGTNAVPVFASNTNPLFGGYVVNQPGYSTGYSSPCMIDDSGSYILLSGSERGYIYRFDNIDGNLGGNFTRTDSMYVSTYEGSDVAPFVADLNNDALFDMIIGNYAGGVSLFYGDLNVSTGTLYSPRVPAVTVYPVPANEQILIATENLFTGKMQVCIFDVAGKKLRETELSSSSEAITVQDLSSGIYLITVRDAKGNCANSKFIITR